MAFDSRQRLDLVAFSRLHLDIWTGRFCMARMSVDIALDPVFFQIAPGQPDCAHEQDLHNMVRATAAMCLWEVCARCQTPSIGYDQTLENTTTN